MRTMLFLLSMLVLSGPAVAQGAAERVVLKPVNPTALRDASFKLDPDTLLSIARENAHVASLLLAFDPDRRATMVNLIAGTASAVRDIDPDTVLRLQRGDAPDAATSSPLPGGATATTIRWTSRRVPDGLRVTFRSTDFDRDQQPLPRRLPTLAIDFADTVPTHVIRWTRLED